MTFGLAAFGQVPFLASPGTGATTYAQACTASTAPLATLIRSSTIPLAATSTPVATLLRQTGCVFQALASQTTSLVRQTGHAVAAQTAPIASLLETATHLLSLSATATSSAALARQTTKPLSATSSPVASASGIRVVLVSLQAASATVASLVRSTSKILAALTSPAATLPFPEPAMASVTTMFPLSRQQGVQIPNIVSEAQWVDAISLTAGTAASYTLPADANGVKATLFRLTATTGPLYINWTTTATVTSSTVTDGTASRMLRTDLDSVFVLAPLSTDTLSVICASNAKLTIEAWK